MSFIESDEMTYIMYLYDTRVHSDTCKSYSLFEGDDVAKLLGTAWRKLQERLAQYVSLGGPPELPVGITWLK